jgi:hypothetical protein
MMLREEDKENKFMKTIGECLEYFISNKLIEYMVAIAMTNNPPGLFNFCLSTICETI